MPGESIPAPWSYRHRHRDGRRTTPAPRLADRQPYDAIEHQVDRAVEIICCRLLEQGTGGRLTFDGDEIVRTKRGQEGRHARTGTN